MVKLIASIVVLFSAPLLHTFFASRPTLRKWFDTTFVVIIIAGMLGFILPHLVEHAGWAVLSFVVIGAIAPTVLEELWQTSLDSVHIVPKILGVLGILVHAAIDGMALASPSEELHWAIIAHRIPDGMIVWWLFQKNDKLASWSVLLALMSCTVAGYFAANYVSNVEEVKMNWAWIQGLAAGAILHLIFHRHRKHQHAGHEHKH